MRIILKYYYYTKLDKIEKKKYRQLKSGINGVEKKISLSGVPDLKTIESLIYDNPELYYCNLREIMYDISPYETKANLTYYFEPEKTDEIRQAAKKIAGYVNSSDSEMTIRKLHNYFVRYVKYDNESLLSGKYEHNSHSVIGPLIYGKAVCEGISMAFKYIMDILNIENTVAVGYIGDKKELHMWNIVEIDGERYHIDVTQDIVTTGIKWDKPSYMYYMLNDREMGCDHIWNENFDCKGEKENPFRKNQREFYNLDELKKYICLLNPDLKTVYFKYRSGESDRIVSRTVSDNIPYNRKYKRLSYTKNNNIYYFIREK